MSFEISRWELRHLLEFIHITGGDCVEDASETCRKISLGLAEGKTNHAVRQRIDAGIKEEQKTNREAEAKRAEAELDHRARAAYFAGNPDASESAYKAIETELKKQTQLNDALDHDRNRARLHSIYSEF